MSWTFDRVTISPSARLHVNDNAAVIVNLGLDEKVNGAKSRGVTMKVSGYDIMSKKGCICSLLALAPRRGAGLVLLVLLALSAPAGNAQPCEIS